ncbi:MAG TPA: histidine kinase dimerization/phospho-acceptor domain-containing protein, partial [Spirochaetota bacterium]|nr:histidine kinase dimerization/phospho-acceptor domain-containing protein [Spirochaetota bacterium]
MLRNLLSNISLAVIIPVSGLILLIFITTNFFIKRGDYLESIFRLKQTAKNVRITADPQTLEIISSSSNNAIAVSENGNLSAYGNLPFSISELSSALVKDRDEENIYLTLNSHDESVYYICNFKHNGRIIYIFQKSGVDSFRPITFFSVISLLVLLTLLFFYFLYQTKIKKPLQKVLLFSDKLISGDYTFRISEDRYGEVFSIIRKMNLIADKIDYQIYRTEIEKKKLNDLFSNISDALAFIDNEGYLLTSNNSFKNIFSITSDSTVKYYDSIRNSETNSAVKKTIESKNEISKTVRISGKTYETLIKPVFYDNSFHGLILSMRDITEKNKIDSFKRELVGNLSHELKTPITIAKGYLETIKNIPDDNNQRIKFIDKTIANLNRQNAIIGDMLKLNMLETTNVFEKENVRMENLISGI